MANSSKERVVSPKNNKPVVREKLCHFCKGAGVNGYIKGGVCPVCGGEGVIQTK